MPTNWQANHGIAETHDDLPALMLMLRAAQLRAVPLARLVPVRRATLFRWCLAQGLRAVRPMTLMKTGEYREPQGICVQA